MYLPETGERLPLLDHAGQPVDDKIFLPTTVVISK
jgi:hypothetical protein